MELLGQMAGFKLIHVPYKGVAPAVVALIGGEVDATIASPPGVMAQVKAGRARGIAVSSAERRCSCRSVMLSTGWGAATTRAIPKG